MVIYPVTNFWLLSAGDKVEGDGGMNGAVHVWESIYAAGGGQLHRME